LRSKFRSPVFLSEHFDVDGADLFESVSRMGLEGIVSKRKDAPYKSGRTETWIKVKCVHKGRFPIVGFIPDVGGISALYLGKRDGQDLIYAGKVGSGFSQKTSTSLRRKLEPLVTKESRLTKRVRKPKAKWVEPRFSADIVYRDITADGLLRQSAFKGMDEG
jgi:bifunctional non-homologous end joining protein LigD